MEHEELRQVLARYDRHSILVLLGALQLVPENAHLTGTLEAMAQVVVGLPAVAGRPEIDSCALGDLVDRHRDELGPDIQPDGPVTEPITFYGGTFTIITGGIRSRAFVPDHLAKGYFQHDSSSLALGSADDDLNLVYAALWLSDLVVQRAELVRYTAPRGKVGDALYVPESERLKKLTEAVSIPISWFEDVLHEEQNSILGVLMAGSADHSERPLVSSAAHVIVAQPARLVACAWHAILLRAQHRGEGSRLLELYHEAVTRTVSAALKRLFMFEIEPPIATSPIRSCTELFFSFDSDKLLYTIVLTQPFGEPPTQLFTEWSPFDDLLSERIYQVTEDIRESMPGVREILCLIAIQDCLGYADVTWDSGERDVPLAILLQAEDLVTLVDLEEGNPLALWKFAGTSKQMRSQWQIHMNAMLDEYELYRRCQFGPYLPADGGDEVVLLPLGGTLDLRMQTVHRRDRHGVPAWEPGAWVEVERVSTDMDLPIYRPVGLLDVGTRLVEGFPIPIWVLGAPLDEISAHTWIGLMYADALSYWLWQLTPHLTPILGALVQPLVLRIELVEDEGWFQLIHSSERHGTSAMRVLVEPSDTSLTVRMEPEAAALFRGMDNTGEREWIRAILHGIWDLCQPHDELRFKDEVIDRILNEVVPVGLKRQIHNFSLRNVPALDERGLVPFYRGVQDADCMAVEYLIGRVLTHDLGHGPGPISHQDQEQLLGAVLHFLFDELERVMIALAGDSLLEILLRQYETLVQRRTARSQFLPMHLACYGSDPRAMELVEEERQDFWNTGAALRFLIEYVTARPPEGTNLVSMSDSDRLVALAVMIIQKGSELDLVRHRLVDLQMEIAPIGLLRVNARQYAQARDRYLQARLRERTDASSTDLALVWRAEPSEEQYRAAESQQVETVGQPLTDLVKLLSHVGGIGDEGPDHGVARVSLETLVRLLSSRLTWSEERVRDVLSLAFLEARPEFLRPPDPYKPHDVWPWRHNRRLSYLRRPLIALKTSSGTDILWGGRHLWEAQHHLWERFRTDRLKDIGQETTHRASIHRLSEGAEFNQDVANLLCMETAFEVHSNIRKVKKHSLSNLGDLDVVAVDKQAGQVWVIECKNLAGAVTPYDVAMDLKEIFGEPGSKSHMQKFFRRFAWLDEHKNEFRDHLGLDPDRTWELRPLFVLSTELLAPHLWPDPLVPVVSYQQLEQNCRRNDGCLDRGYDERR